jgi:endonuclease-3
MQKQKIDQIFTYLSESSPGLKTELCFSNDFTLLVAIILSAQATDKSVNKATKSLFKIADNISAMLKLGEDGLKSHIKTIGLFNTKAKNIISLSKILLEKYHSLIPSTFEELISLPGVGRKTANVYLNCVYNHPVIAVDTHVFRVSNRLGLTNAKNALESETILNDIIDIKWRVTAHNLLIFHGRYVCKAIKPLCSDCVVNYLCKKYNEQKL